MSSSFHQGSIILCKKIREKSNNFCLHHFSLFIAAVLAAKRRINEANCVAHKMGNRHILWLFCRRLCRFKFIFCVYFRIWGSFWLRLKRFAVTASTNLWKSSCNCFFDCGSAFFAVYLSKKILCLLDILNRFSSFLRRSSDPQFSLKHGTILECKTPLLFIPEVLCSEFWESLDLPRICFSRLGLERDFACSLSLRFCGLNLTKEEELALILLMVETKH